MLFDGEACAKGTALVANASEDAMRDPRSQRAARRGSSGGRARGISNDRSGRSSRGDARLFRSGTTAIAHRTPRAERDAVRWTARSHADENVRVVETAETEAAGVGNPARTSREARTLRAIRNVEGERNPMRGGVYIGLGRGETLLSWMSTGRPRVMC
jgi:hypothetical protein